MLFAFALSSAALVSAQSFSTPKWSGAFDTDSGVLRSLKPSIDPSFDFSPSDVFANRSGTGNYHTGDITLRWRVEGQTAWDELDTAAQRSLRPTSKINATQNLLDSDFDALTANYSAKLNVHRSWKEVDGDLVLDVAIKNPNEGSVIEIGAFGFPIEFNNIFTGRDPIETANKCVLVDPYIGLDAGYVQVTRLRGTGPAMVITPHGNSTKFEAWRFLHEPSVEPLLYQSQTYEGNFAWQTLSKAYAEEEWNSTEPWNDATSKIIQPGQSITFGLRFSAVSDIQSIESAVASTDTPLAIGIPGYILTSDLNGKLFLKSSSEVKSIARSPAGALAFTLANTTSAEWMAYDVISTGGHGRVRTDITYEDGRLQTVHYYITGAAPEHVAKHANFLFTEQWMGDSDVFKRSPGIITYDWENRTKVEQDYRVWIAGLQDEGGAASYVAAALKTAYHPLPEQVRMLEQMATITMWGNMQYNETDGEYPIYTVKRSLFFYDPEAEPGYPYDPSLDWSTWASWNKTEASQVWRPYNYVWVSALYWALYHAEQVSPGILTLQDSSWYLDKAYRTAKVWYGQDGEGENISEFRDVGFMGETVWLELLKDLEAEGLTEASNSLHAVMQERQVYWAGREDPFGSEMAWDSTGQEGVYIWSKYFEDNTTVQKTLESIRGFTPTVAHWAWNGNARRYWDFSVAGGIARIERQIHHYGSPLNAIPMLDSYKYSTDPTGHAALHDLRIGYGGWLGALTNINEEGFGSQGFHAWPDTMEWDPYSSDYGCGLLGHMISSTTFLIENSEFGYLSFGGNLVSSGDVIKVEPRDTVRRQIYVAPLGLKFEISAGVIEEFTYNVGTKSLTIKVGADASASGTVAAIRWEDTLGLGAKMQENSTAVSLPGEVSFSLS